MKNHYLDLKDMPFYGGLCKYMSSGPVLAMVCPLHFFSRPLEGVCIPQTRMCLLCYVRKVMWLKCTKSSAAEESRSGPQEAQSVSNNGCS